MNASSIRLDLMSGVLLLGSFANLAQAGTMSFDLLGSDPPISGFTGPYAHITVDLLPDNKTANITIDSLNDGAHWFLLGGNSALGLNVNASNFTTSVTTATNSFAGFTSGPMSLGGSGNVDGWGSFNSRYDDTDGYINTFDHLVVQVLNTSTWASVADVLLANAKGNVAAAHVFVTADLSPSPSEGVLATGYVAGTGGSTPPTPPDIVPEPGILSLLAVGALTMNLARKQKA